MYPVWVKLGDFGVSKRILAQATTTLHTQVSTPLYSAPEVLGLDPNSETSEYTNSVDIWSLGCVIYELVVGTKLFVSEFQLSGYFYGKWPFPEDRLRGLSPPTDDIGISLLKAMLKIQPEDRPTAADALSNGWLADLESSNDHSRDGRSGTTQCGYRSIPSRKHENTLATHDRPKERRSERNRISQADTRCVPRGVAMGAGEGSQRGSGPATRRGGVGASIIVPSPSDAASAGSSRVETGLPESELMLGNFQATDSKEPNVLRRNGGILNTPQTCLQSNTPNAELNPLTKRVANENWVLNPRPLPSDPPTPDLYRRNSRQTTRETDGPMEHQRKKIPKARSPTTDNTTSRTTYGGTPPTRRRRFG